MATHDYVIDNQSASAFRTDLNNALQAILTQNSNATAPATTAANMIWYDTSTDLLKIRNEANSGWITVGTVNQSTSNFESATVNGKTIGTLTAAGGIAYATSSTALAAIGAGTSGQVLQSNAASAPSWASSQSIGVGQTWQSVTRVAGTSYQNTTGRPIMAAIRGSNSNTIDVSANNSTWFSVATLRSASGISMTGIAVIIPTAYYYRVTAGTIDEWVELR